MLLTDPAKLDPTLEANKAELATLYLQKIATNHASAKADSLKMYKKISPPKPYLQICEEAESRTQDALSRVHWLARALLLAKKAEIEAT